MPALLKADWTGFVGAPGVSSFSITNSADQNSSPTSSAVTAAAAALRVFYDSIKAYLPSTVTISWSGTCGYVNNTDGQLVSTIPYTPPAVVVGTSVSSYAAPAGISVAWRTGQIVNGRLLRGRTFLVPIGQSGLQADGTAASAALTAIGAAATALITSSAAASDWRLSVWHRPVGGTGGVSSVVLTATVKDEIAVLRSRRN